MMACTPGDDDDGTDRAILLIEGEAEIHAEWRRRADSNRCIKVLQTSPLATWVRRHENKAVL